jgi:hypothetical protein
MSKRDGVHAGPASSISENAIYQSGDDGIQTDGPGCTISGNTIYQSGSDGIESDGGSTVEGNTVAARTGYGLNFSNFTLSGSSYRENTITVTGTGTVNGAAVNAGGNVCNGSLTCP